MAGLAMHVGSDTRAKSQAQAFNDAEFAIKDVGLQVSFSADPHIGGVGKLDCEGADVAVLVTCLTFGSRTFIEFVGVSEDSSAAEHTRNRVRSLAMGAPS